jgi:hypothetical protein
MAVYVIVYAVFALLLATKLLWICGLIASFFNFLAACVLLGCLLLTGAGAMEVACDCRCGFCVLILYICAHVAILLTTEIGATVFKIEVGMVIVGVHCIVGVAYLKYNS